MKFSKIIGTSSNPETKTLINRVENKLSILFTELGLNIDNRQYGSKMGGDFLIFSLVYPMPHICHLSAIQLDELLDKQIAIDKRIAAGEKVPEEELVSKELKTFRQSMRGKVLRTAATNGKAFFYEPKFIDKLSLLGLRIVINHEATHAIFMHPSRRGSRHPGLYNIAIDFKVNFLIISDLKARSFQDYVGAFETNLGEFIRLEEYASFLKDPFNPPERLAHLNPMHSLKAMTDPGYEHPADGKKPMYYAADNLSHEMKRPENIYSYLYEQIPKCPKCNKLGKYKKPQEYKDLEKKIKEQEKNFSHKHTEEQNQGMPQAGDKNSSAGQASASNGQGNEACCGGCGECGGDDYIDMPGAGHLLDEHMDSDVTEDELKKRIANALHMAKGQKATAFGAGLEEEFGTLIAPKMRWEDFVKQRMLKKRYGNGRSDWTSPRTRPLFAGLYLPRKTNKELTICCLYDCSGSMDKEQIASGISQLQVLDDRAEMWLLPFDVNVYPESMIKIKKANKENLMQTKIKGRGGTMCNIALNSVEKYCGKVDMVIIITDSFLADLELKDVKIEKGVDYLWLVTSHNPSFKPPFGRVFNMLNE